MDVLEPSSVIPFTTCARESRFMTGPTRKTFIALNAATISGVAVIL